MKTSIIIVDYKNKEGLQRCLDSLHGLKEAEVIVIDNNKDNVGFAKGCNRGALQATGEILFFLNPDSVVVGDAIKVLKKVLLSFDSTGIVAPKLTDEQGKPYLSYTQQASFWCSFVVYSFVDSWWQGNPCSRKYWYASDSLSKRREVESVSGAAFMIRADDFASLGGFDERMFMYWEDYDLCWRMLRMGKKIMFVPDAEVMHSKAGSTPANSSEIKAWFRASRYQYFKNRFGTFRAAILHVWLSGTERFGRGTSSKILTRETHA